MRLGKIRNICLAVLTLFVGVSTRAQLKNSDEFAKVFNSMLETKDTTGISDFLASDFAIAGHTGMGARLRLQQLIKGYAPERMRVLDKKNTEKGVMYEIEIAEKSGRQSRSHMLVNAAGKVRYLTYFDQRYGLWRSLNSKLVARIPFENKDGSIILQVKINGVKRPLRLLFDTGADGMAVGKALADEIGLQVTRENTASVVGGQQTIQVSENNTVQLDTLSLKGMGIAIFPQFDKANAEGIIGNTLIQRYITHIDYDNNVLSLYSFGSYSYPKQGHLVQVGMPSNLMLVPATLEIIQNKKYEGQFVFDTGASYDLICFRKFVRKNKLLVSGFKPEVQASTVSLGIASPTFIGASYQFGIASLAAMPNLPVTLMGASSSNEQWDPGADGSIGVRLLSRYNMTINMAENEVFFSPNKLHALPQDFILKGYQFGWNNSGQLLVLGTIGAVEPVEGINKGAIIQKIDGYTAGELAKKQIVIEKLKSKSKQGEKIATVFENHETVLF